MAPEEKVDRGGLYLLLSGVGLLVGCEALTFVTTGTLLSGRGLGFALGVGVGAAVVSLLVFTAFESLATRMKRAALRFVGPALLLAAALACAGFLLVPILRRSNDSFGYKGQYRVEYSDGRTENVDGATLSSSAWNAYAGASLGGTLTLLLCGVCGVVGALRRARGEKPA